MRSMFLRWCVQWNASTIITDEVCVDGTIQPWITSTVLRVWNCLVFSVDFLEIFIHLTLFFLGRTQLVSVLDSMLLLCMFMGCLSLSCYGMVVNCWWCYPSCWWPFWYMTLCSVWKCLCRRSIWWKKPGVSIAYWSCMPFCVVLKCVFVNDWSWLGNKWWWLTLYVTSPYYKSQPGELSHTMVLYPCVKSSHPLLGNNHHIEGDCDSGPCHSYTVAV